jgi:hypothetical protein
MGFVFLLSRQGCCLHEYIYFANKALIEKRTKKPVYGMQYVDFILIFGNTTPGASRNLSGDTTSNQVCFGQSLTACAKTL